MQGGRSTVRLDPDRLDRLVWLLALACGVAPLWASQALPLVDLPQHLHLISVLHRLDDPSTLYPEVFARRPELTPYLGYYYLVSLLHWLFPLDLANRLFLSAYVAGLPLSLAFLLRSVRRPTWPALLALPFAYGDSFAWGFINYVAALPLAVVTCGLFVRAIEDAPRRRRWAGLLAFTLSAVLLFHVQAFAWLAVALPLLLLLTPAPEGPSFRPRVPALLGLLPGVTLFILWVGLRLGQPQEIAPGQPWRSWGPMLSPENLGWKPFAQNLSELVTVRGLDVQFPILAGMTPGGTDQHAVRLVLALAMLATVLGLARRAPLAEGAMARLRMPGLAALALVLFFALPFDIRGYMYYLNTRYAHLAAALLVASVPVLPAPWSRRGLWAAAGASVVLLVPLWSAFSTFDAESRALAELATSAGDRPRTMGLIWSPGSRAVTHPVYLHAACVIARERGGLTNFSFALTPHSPLMYRGPPPPTFDSEWRPDHFDWERHGTAYDHFLVRGPPAERLFGGRLGSELAVVARSGDFTLLRRLGPARP